MRHCCLRGYWNEFFFLFSRLSFVLSRLLVTRDSSPARYWTKKPLERKASAVLFSRFLLLVVHVDRTAYYFRNIRLANLFLNSTLMLFSISNSELDFLELVGNLMVAGCCCVIKCEINGKHLSSLFSCAAGFFTCAWLSYLILRSRSS